jgi:MerR family transcriptional regulator, multidrug-efflux activator
MTIGQTAKLAGISVRTLHYYDQIGLLRPQTSESSYRVYSEADLEKLWQILFFRELDFPLEQIKAILADPSFDRKSVLQNHRRLLTEKKNRLERLIASIDQTLEKGFDTSMLKTFDKNGIEEHRKKYAAEAAAKYGEAYRESEKRTSGYTEKDWQANMQEAQEIFDALARCMDLGAGSPQAQELISKWRQHISEKYYDCTPEIFRGLGELYTMDTRFTENIDRTRPGLAAFLKQAIDIYCDKRG